MSPWSFKQQKKDIQNLRPYWRPTPPPLEKPRFLTSVESDHRHEVRWVVEPVKFQELLEEFIAKCTPKQHNTFFFESSRTIFYDSEVHRSTTRFDYKTLHDLKTTGVAMFTSTNFYPSLTQLGHSEKPPTPHADGLVPLGRCGGLPWAPWALAWHLAWLSLPWRRGMRVTPTPFLRWLPGRWMTVQCSCWKNRQKYQKDAISGWGFETVLKVWHGTWMVVSFANMFFIGQDLGSLFYAKPFKKMYIYIYQWHFWQFDTLHCFVGFWFDDGGYCGLAMLAGNLIAVLDFFLDPWTQRKFRLMIATSSNFSSIAV